jgi:signal transduction histidine kinase
MSSPQQGNTHTATAGGYPIALSIQLGRNMIVQILGMTMVSLVGLVIIPWPFVLGWTLMAMASAGVEDHLLRVVARDGPGAARAARWAPVLRVIVTTIYALAAYVLIAKGGGPERLFAISLMSASMVHVLMRYYRSPAILAASLSPYLLILGAIGVGQIFTALKHGNALAVLTAPFTIALVAVQFWAARNQLAGAWDELMLARNAAEDRERAAAAANRAKSNFLATMSHELRTPLNGVLGMAQALTCEQLSDTQRERVKVIRRSSESLLAVLNDLLDLSKIETHSLELEIGEFDLEHLVRGVVAAYVPLAR